jgi:hypothetical protein
VVGYTLDFDHWYRLRRPRVQPAPDKFLEEFNNCVAQDRRYPITIKFYKDEEWSELRDLIDDFKDGS